MKAIRVKNFGPPEVMRLEEIPDPMPGKGEVVVKLHAAGINPVEINPHALMACNGAIHGTVSMLLTEHESRSIHAALYSGLENSTLRPLIGKQLPLAEAGRAHHEIMESPALGKIILVP